MKRYFCIAIVLMALASCGEDESSKTVEQKEEPEEAPEDFGYEMPLEALQSTTPYEGTGNTADGNSR